MTVYNFTKPYHFDLVQSPSAGGGIQSTNAGSNTETLSDVRDATRKTVKDSEGWRIPTPYSRVVRTGDVKTYYVTQNTKRSDGWKNVGSGSLTAGGAWSFLLPASPSYLDDQCITRALLKLKAQDVNWAQNIGEASQTADLVYDSCRRLAVMAKGARETYSALKRGRNVAKTLADIWLEYQYAWKPLLSDVHSAVTTLANDPPDRRTTTVTGTAQERFYEKVTLSEVSAAPGAALIFDRITRGVQNVFVRLDYVQNVNPMLALFAQSGFTNPLDLAWELLPFSFVVDWFIPIGDFFNCLDATVGWSFRGGSISRVQRYKSTASNIRYNPGSGWPDTGLSVSGKAYYVNMTRSVYSSSPLPSRPHFIDKRSSTHVANGIALLTAAFTGGSHVR